MEQELSSTETYSDEHAEVITDNPFDNVENIFVDKISKLKEDLTIPDKLYQEQLSKISEAYGMDNIVNLREITPSSIPQVLVSTEYNELESAERLREMGTLYMDVSGYLNEYFTQSESPDSRSVKTLNTLTDFFSIYGSELAGAPDDQGVRERIILSDERKVEIDRFIMGKEVYENRLNRLKSKFGEEIPKTSLDELRTRVIRNYISSLSREGSVSPDKENPLKEKKGPFANLQEKSIEKLTFSSHQPTRELIDYLAQKGGEKFLTEKKFDNEQSLFDLLKMDELKADFEKIKEFGTEEDLSVWIKKTVDNLSTNVSNIFQYKKNDSSVTSMTEAHTANCAGFTLIGSLLLKELGINYVEICGTRHAFIGYTTPDKSTFTNDFQGDKSVKITSDDLNNLSPEQVSLFINNGERTVMPVRLSVGSTMNWWGPDGGKNHKQETVYLYRDVEPGLMNEILKIQLKGMKLTPEIVFGSENSIHPYMLSSEAQYKSAIKYSPDDPNLYYDLADIASENNGEMNIVEKASLAKWHELTNQAKLVNNKVDQLSFLDKLKKRFK